MTEAGEAISLAAPFISYVLPAVFIISVLVIADKATDFLLNLIRSMRSRVTMK